jgi:hypothetical protein
MRVDGWKMLILHLVRNPEKRLRFSRGPSVDKVFRIGVTHFVAFGEGKEANSNELSKASLGGKAVSIHICPTANGLRCPSSGYQC